MANGESSVQESATFAEAVTAGFALVSELRLDKSGSQLPVKVALPARHSVFERLTLPSGDRDELAGMVRLQFEKSLPYPAEETALGFQILSQIAAPAGNGEETPAGVQTTLLACGAHHAAISTFCAPLLAHCFPQRLIPWALHVAAQAPAGEVSCGLWREEGELLFAIFENRRLGFVEILASADDVLSALPRALMSAEMAGVPTDFHAVLLDPSLAGLAEPLTAFLGAPMREIALRLGELPEGGDSIDLTPESWRAEQAAKKRYRTLRRQLCLAGAAYALLVAAALVYLGILGGQLETAKKEAASIQTRADTVLDQQNRWKALAPAIDQRLFAVELLFQTCQSLPNPEARITRFDLARGQFMVEGEALNAQQAIEFVEKLKSQPSLADFRFESGQPVILANEHAQFRIFGKL